MAVYRFSRELNRFDTDRTTEERHLVGNNKINRLDRNYIHKIQERFHELGFGYMVGNINGCFNQKLYAAILSFQQQSKSTFRNVLIIDEDVSRTKEVNVTFMGKVNGVFNKETANEMNIWLENNYRNSCRTPLRAWGKTWIRDGMAKKLDSIKNALRIKKCYFPTNSIACFRSPSNMTISTGMKKKSLHLAALAFDLDEWRGMQNPEKDIYYISDRDGKYWDVFLKTEDETVPLSKKEFIFYDFDTNKYWSKQIYARFVNLSNLLNSKGFEPIGRKVGWENEYYLTEWWHYQLQDIQELKWAREMENIGYPEIYLKESGYID